MINTTLAGRGLFLLFTIIFIMALLPVPASSAPPTIEWIRRENGNASNNDEGRGVVADSSGNVYVTGDLHSVGSAENYGTFKYNSAGTAQWRRQLDGSVHHTDRCLGIGMDGAGNIYVTGSCHNVSPTNWDFKTVKYDGSGSAKWVRIQSWQSTSSEDFATAIAVDSAGNSYIAGISKDNTNYYDYAVVKYNTSGTRQWCRKYGGPAGKNDEVTDIAVDGSGNVYVTGWSINSSGNRDYATVKWDANGNIKWVRRFDSPYNDEDTATAISVDGSGNPIVTGRSKNSFDGNYDWVTIKYRQSDGLAMWGKRYDYGLFSSDYANDIAVDSGGSVYVAGAIAGWAAIIKYSAGGTGLWRKLYSIGNTVKWDKITLDGSGNAYVTGYDIINRSGSNFDNDYLTAKYSSSGVIQWVNRYNYAVVNGDDEPKAIFVDGSNNVYVTGWSAGNGTYTDYLTIKYSQN